MTTFTELNLIISILFGIILILFYFLFKKKQSTNSSSKIESSFDNNLNQITKLGWKVKGLLIGALILILISFLVPFIFTRPSFKSDLDFSIPSQIGDTIGGLMNPFIALAGVLVTGIAFYIQYKANLLQRELFVQEQKENQKQIQGQIDNQNRQIEIQQFESQFYEMLKLHRENVTEMKISGYDFEEVGKLKKVEKITEGRKVFVTMKTEFECILALFVKDKKLDKELFHKCYKLFFSGLDEFEKAYDDEYLIIGLLKKARKQHEYPESSKIRKNQERKEFLPDVKLYFNYKPFSGHASRLGHYFRHLYMTVKSVANSHIITDYEERMKYLRILRAQLSNHEQILLFYNWLSEYGIDWENDKHSFLTEYCMIHNLWIDNLFQDQYISKTLDYLRDKDVLYRKDNMFELD